MKAMIFAAGLGTRLYPITKNKPKALAPFLGTTLLGHNLKYLANQGVSEFIINTHHFADKIEHYLKENDYFDLDITLSYEEILLDTAGGLVKAKKYFSENEDVLLYNVDVISNIDIVKMHNFHKINKAKATLAVRNRETSRYFLFDKQHRLSGWINKNTGEKKPSNYRQNNLNEFAFSGIHMVNMSLFQELNEEKQSITPFYLDNMDNNIIQAYEHNSDYWFDCGKVETLKQAEEFIINN